MRARGEGLACATYVNDEIAGYIILDIHGKKHGQLHYGLAPSHRGRGIVTKACAALIEYAFGHLKLESIKIIVRASNERSCRVPERLGFQKLSTEWAHDEDEDGPLIQVAEYIMTRGAWQGRQGGRN